MALVYRKNLTHFTEMLMIREHKFKIIQGLEGVISILFHVKTAAIFKPAA